APLASRPPPARGARWSKRDHGATLTTGAARRGRSRPRGQRLHGLVDAVEHFSRSELGQDAEAIERLLRAHRFQPGNGEAVIAAVIMRDELAERARRREVDVGDAARLEHAQARRSPPHPPPVSPPTLTPRTHYQPQ